MFDVIARDGAAIAAAARDACCATAGVSGSSRGRLLRLRRDDQGRAVERASDARGTARHARSRRPTRSSIAACARCGRSPASSSDAASWRRRRERPRLRVRARVRDVSRRSVLLRRAAGLVVSRYAVHAERALAGEAPVARGGARDPARAPTTTSATSCSPRFAVREHSLGPAGEALHAAERAQRALSRGLPLLLAVGGLDRRRSTRTVCCRTEDLVAGARAAVARGARRLLHGDERPRSERARHRADHGGDARHPRRVSRPRDLRLARHHGRGAGARASRPPASAG